MVGEQCGMRALGEEKRSDTAIACIVHKTSVAAKQLKLCLRYLRSRKHQDYRL